jgi:hypothetical protein
MHDMMLEGRLEAIQPALTIPELRMQGGIAFAIEEYFTARIFPVR